MTSGCAKPENASLTGIIPKTIKTKRAPIETASYLNFPQIKKPRRIINVAESMNWLLSDIESMN
jgi:hypothetical protein